MQDGLLLLENDDQRQPGYLVSSVAARDFIAHVRCRVIEGDSGLFYRGRVDPRTPTTIQGPQVQLNVTPDRSLGGLFETQGRGWLCRVPLEQNARLLHGLDWIECTIEARGPHIQVTVNGEVTADFHDNPDANPFAGRGFFALQIHGGGFCRVLFEDIRVLVMDV